LGFTEGGETTIALHRRPYSSLFFIAHLSCPQKRERVRATGLRNPINCCAPVDILLEIMRLFMQSGALLGRRELPPEAASSMIGELSAEDELPAE